MSVEIIIAKTFVPEFKRLRKKYRSLETDVKHLVADLRTKPLQGTDLGHHMRKIRLPISSKGRGKSGGGRVITHTVIVAQTDASVTLLAIYDKSERETVTDAELRELLKKNGLLWPAKVVRDVGDYGKDRYWSLVRH